MTNTNEIFVDRDVEESVTSEVKPKKKQKKEVSAERRAILLAQLKKGRETAQKNRLAKKSKNSEEKTQPKPQPQPQPQEKEKPQETEIKKTWSVNDDINDLRYQLRELKNLMHKSKKEEIVEAKIEKIIEKKEIIEEKQTPKKKKIFLGVLTKIEECKK